MQQFAQKQRWKVALFVAGAAIVGLTLWYSGTIARTLRKEEQLKVQLWSEAIVQRAELVRYTERLFESLRKEERSKANLLIEGYRLLEAQPPGSNCDVTLNAAVIQANQTIPLLVQNERGLIEFTLNLPLEMSQDSAAIDSLARVLRDRGSVIRFDRGASTVYYDESTRFRELRAVMSDLIKSFITQTVINSASIPVLLLDSTRTKLVRTERIGLSELQDTAALIADFSTGNPPIVLDLPEVGRQYILYDESMVLKQLRFFPIIQLIIIAGFLLFAYLIFSTFRRVEQNRVWVGMAKETAHQLGTPLSALLAWVHVLEEQGLDPEIIVELNKDLDRLQTVADRFSKIGSEPELKRLDLADFVQDSIKYMKPRMPRRVTFQVDVDPGLQAKFSPPLYGWVLENLVKNAVDAMAGDGTLTVHLSRQNRQAMLDITDTGKGIPKSQHRSVFEPGFTTKKRGWGLGLSLVKRIVEQYHGGKIFVLRSEEGAGTTFRVTLPLDS
jgi:signal transduction histidine kinase